jgi:uncharacterized hydrophobic protein (TIGR00271 family)
VISRKLFTYFTVREEKEDFDVAFANIYKAIDFKGTNLWILIFAIFMASLGLNVNSTSVIIGAMLISPLMGPCLGIGLSVAINDLRLLRKAATNLLMAMSAGLATSTLYFLISPLDDAHSELLASTSPTIYDVLIALFGGAAATLATFSKQKGNVIPGAAIATALMPPLCTAGFGLATGNWNFFIGAFYLFIINAVFIAYATLVTARLLRFPMQQQLDAAAQQRTKRVTSAIVVMTLVPSVYLGYQIVQQDRFNTNALQFIEKEAHLTNDYLLSKKIDPKEEKIVLVFGGREITKEEINELESKLTYYDLHDARLEVLQGFAYLDEENGLKNEEATHMSKVVSAQEAELMYLRHQLDSVKTNDTLGTALYAELKVYYPTLVSATYNASTYQVSDSGANKSMQLVTLRFKRPPARPQKQRILQWAQTRLKTPKVKVVFE